MQMPRPLHHVGRSALIACALLSPTVVLGQRYTIEYTVSLTEPASHLYAITLFVGGLRGANVDLQMPVWSPGRYAKMDFARNVQDFTVTSADGKPLRWTKVNGSRWRVTPGASRSMTVSYRVFANAPMSGTFSVLDTIHANWNGPSLFVYVDGHKSDPVSLSVVAPDGWTIINGDVTRPGQRLFHFPNYDLMVDTPTEVAPPGVLILDTFIVDNRLYRVMVHHNGAVADSLRDRFKHEVESIVRYENSVFGAPPLDQYTFMFNIGFPGGDGMEHLFSTQIQHPRVWSENARLLPGVSTAAHEYFHVWNVKRVRPAVLGPFDYTVEQYQPSLWVAEGWTQYYGMATLRRAGIITDSAFYANMAALIQANLTAPGRKHTSARMASFHAPFWDGAPQPQPTNLANTFFDYYTHGAGIAAYLDLFIRHVSGNSRSLNDAFGNLKRRSWDAPTSSYYLQGRGYTEDDVERAVSDAAGVRMHEWFDAHVGGTEDVDYDEALSWAGIRLVRPDSGSWSLELLPDPTPDQLRVRLGWLTGRLDGSGSPVER